MIYYHAVVAIYINFCRTLSGISYRSVKSSFLPTAPCFSGPALGRRLGQAASRASFQPGWLCESKTHRVPLLQGTQA